MGLGNMDPRVFLMKHFYEVSCNIIYKRSGIKIKIIIQYNHDTLNTKKNTRTMSEMTAQQLTGIGQMWTHHIHTYTYAPNIFARPTSNGLS